MDKNIPCELGDIDCIFYDLDKQVDFTLLEKMYQDYKMYEREQKKEEENHKVLGGMPPLDEEDDLPPMPSIQKTVSTLPQVNAKDLAESNDIDEDDLPPLNSIMKKTVSTMGQSNFNDLTENNEEFDESELPSLGSLKRLDSSVHSIKRGNTGNLLSNMSNLIENNFEDDDLDGLGLSDIGLKRSSNC